MRYARRTILISSFALLAIPNACGQDAAEPAAQDAGTPEASIEDARPDCAVMDTPPDATSGKGGGPPEPTPPIVWEMAGVLVYDPKSFPAETYGPILKANHFGWVSLQIIDGLTEKWPCDGPTCGQDTAEGWLASFRPYVTYVGAWGVNRANGSVEEVSAEAKLTVDLMDAYDAAGSTIDFYIADAEAEYEYSKCGACFGASDHWTAAFRAKRPTFTAAITSYGRTDRSDIGWMTWRDRGFAFLPQAYWNDPNMSETFKPSHCVDFGSVCPGSAAASAKGLDCVGSRTDCPCWPISTIHPMIAFGWGVVPPTIDDYVADLVLAKDSFGAVGFSIFEAQYIPPSSAAWTTLGQAIAHHGIARLPR